ncbi:MAG: S53 family peptidase [Phycisphaerales bacterium]|nr:S53 family peptidase [Phycisphaerales bacterium]
MRHSAGQKIVVESLEPRQLLSYSPTGMTPTQIRAAYKIDQIQFLYKNLKLAGDGAGQTIAIVNANDAPNIADDLHRFDATFGISDLDAYGRFALTKVMPQGKASADAGWSLETSLDVEWAHAVAPKAHILLVEARTSSLSDLLSAVNYARRRPGVVAVSMSWGGDEFGYESMFDGTFTTPAGHIGGFGIRGGVTFVTASGDSGAPAGWPAVSPNALVVGGTTLHTGSGGNYHSETGWSDSGGGLAWFENTASPDVAYDADPKSGFSVYDSTGGSNNGPWYQVGGTSAGSPQWAALVAIADQGRGYLGKGSMDGRREVLPDLYQMSTADFHDITSGFNGYFAQPGYDLVTGLGSPVANELVDDLVQAPSVSPALYRWTNNASAASRIGAWRQLRHEFAFSTHQILDNNPPSMLV